MYIYAAVYWFAYVKEKSSNTLNYEKGIVKNKFFLMMAFVTV